MAIAEDVKHPAANRRGGSGNGIHDVVVIGGGHNGLVCASYLARGGLKVAVLERRHIVGGAAVTEEIHPGFRCSIFSYLLALIPPKIMRDLELVEHGLEVLPADSMLTPLEGDDYLLLSGDPKKTHASLARLNRRDADAYFEFQKHLDEAAAIMRRLFWEKPFDPSKRDWKNLKEMASFAWRYRKIGKGFYRMVDFLTMSADDYLARWFEDERIRAIFAYFAVIGTFAGPKTPGTAYVILHHVMGELKGAGRQGFVRGGMGAITQAIAAYATKKGVEIRTSSAVRTIRRSPGGLQEVVLDDGTSCRAKAVACNASAKALYLGMLDEREIPPETLAAVRDMRTFSSAFKINIACERLPQYKVLAKARADGALGAADYPTYVHIGPDIEYLERAYDDAKYGWYSSRPFITPLAPSVVDDTLAPPGKHVVSLFGGHASYKLRNASWEQERPRFEKSVFGLMDEYAPGFSSDIIHAQVLLPEDMERIVNLPQGHIFHGELTLDQMFFKRPIPHYADYRTPVRGVYLCGASAHPGGAVSGLPGHNAAREILRDFRAGVFR